ncbi:hypothetical protein C6558_13025 [Ensifer sp. NM-2]|uniref:hypothetical protein n=1 Tax=unclassified Ensifer TaxID=2633371 RepID=UPI00070ED268|nr:MULTISPECIES: hypothetical protein [unclassified Ensifer]KQW61556.1 hypothetical protein ASD03_36505 [Ensifer sp. Root127]PSS64431.1 hypothetical protein C6558_13025 [Ensifer sp. NM-2]
MSLKTLTRKAMGGNGPEPFERPYERLWCHRLEETMGDIRMYERHKYGQPEKTASTGLPIGVMLLSVAAIAVYLIAGGEILNDKSGDVAVYLPKVEAK